MLYLLDQYETLNNMLTQLSQDADFGILLGDELGLPTLKNCGMVISRVDLPQGGMGHLTVLGPYRLNYQKVIPTVKYLQKLLNELNRTW